MARTKAVTMAKEAKAKADTAVTKIRSNDDNGQAAKAVAEAVAVAAKDVAVAAKAVADASKGVTDVTKIEDVETHAKNANVKADTLLNTYPKDEDAKTVAAAANGVFAAAVALSDSSKGVTENVRIKADKASTKADAADNNAKGTKAKAATHAGNTRAAREVAEGVARMLEMV
eukprot:Tbor_TRINITY_DN5492_c2_g2::TRINITY_DN5492_c2_g2_i1::g.25467::m.25467